MQLNEARPFATIESSLEFMHLLSTAIAETAADVQKDIDEGTADRRHAEALQLVQYKLNQLSLHVGKSERLLRDLGRLRTLILSEAKARTPVATSAVR
jgi:hypothetical protein